MLVVKKVLSIILISLILIVVCIAQDNQNQAKFLPIPVCLAGKTVFINEDGEIILKILYFRITKTINQRYEF